MSKVIPKIAHQVLLFIVITVVLTIQCTLIRAQEKGSAPDLESQILKSAPEILDHLRENKLRTTGVLKFTVRIGSDGQFPPNVGNLNMRLAEKIGTGLGNCQ